MKKRKLKRSVVVTALALIIGLALSYIFSKVDITEIILILMIVLISMIIAVIITYEDYEKKLRKSYLCGCMSERRKHPATINILIAGNEDE